METTATDLRLSFDERNQPELTLTLAMPRRDAMSKVHKLKEVVSNGKKLKIKVDQHRNRRSLDANAYCWVLCDKIAQVINGTKEEVYLEVIRSVGVFSDALIKGEAVETYINYFSSQGVGNQAEAIASSAPKGYSTVRAYWGSSLYDTKQMARLIDELVYQAKELDIETMPPDELESLKRLWEGKQ